MKGRPSERAETVAFINETADLINRLGKVRDEGAAAERRRIVEKIRVDQQFWLDAAKAMYSDGQRESAAFAEQRAEALDVLAHELDAAPFRGNREGGGSNGQ